MADAGMNGVRQNAPMLFPNVATPTEADHWQGNRNATVTLVEYGDYECPYCIQAEPLAHQLVERYHDRMVFVFRHYPLTEIHPHAELAAEAAEAAAAQGAFWPMHHALFRQRRHLGAPALREYAEEVGLDTVRFDRDMAARTYADRVTAHRQSAASFGLRATPTFLLDGIVIDVSFGLDRLEAALRKALNPA
jgi:protein-disulfide isomerase